MFSRKLKSILGLLLLFSLIALPSFGQRLNFTTLQNAAVATGPGVVVPIGTYTTIGLEVNITGVATVTFQGSLDVTWLNVGCYLMSSTTLVTTATASGLYRCNVGGLTNFRANITSYSSGTVTVGGVLTLAKVSDPGGATPSLQAVFDTGKTITDATSEANAFQVGQTCVAGAPCLRIWADGTNGTVLKSVPAQDAVTQLSTGFFFRVQNNASTDIFKMSQAASTTLSQGSVLYYDATGVNTLAPGTSGQLLKTNGAAANPSWGTGSSHLHQFSCLTPATAGTTFAFGSAGFAATGCSAGDTVGGTNREIETIAFGSTTISCISNGAPASTNSWQFIGRKNAVDLPLTCTISGAATSCNATDTTGGTLGDTLSVKVVTTGTPTSQAIVCGLQTNL